MKKSQLKSVIQEVLNEEDFGYGKYYVGNFYKGRDGGEYLIKQIYIQGGRVPEAYVLYQYKSPDGERGKEVVSMNNFIQNLRT